MFKRRTKPTQIVVQYDAGFPNTLYVRGKGIPGLSWERGIAMKNTRRDEWVFEVDGSFNAAEFKIVLNDKVFEAGENHRIAEGAHVRIAPKF